MAGERALGDATPAERTRHRPGRLRVQLAQGQDVHIRVLDTVFTQGLEEGDNLRRKHAFVSHGIDRLAYQEHSGNTKGGMCSYVLYH